VQTKWISLSRQSTGEGAHRGRKIPKQGAVDQNLKVVETAMQSNRLVKEHLVFPRRVPSQMGRNMRVPGVQHGIQFGNSGLFPGAVYRKQREQSVGAILHRVNIVKFREIETLTRDMRQKPRM
jgi:hypothetical protein